MISTYRGFRIQIKKEKSACDDILTTTTAERIFDGWMLLDDCTIAQDGIRCLMKDTKDLIDDYFKNPADYCD